MKQPWILIKDDRYRIPGDTFESGLFSERTWEVAIFLFLNRETGEIKMFRRSYVEHIGLDNVLANLNK